MNESNLQSSWRQQALFQAQQGYLQISDDGVLYILLLFLQEVETHSIQCVRAQFIVPQEHLIRQITPDNLYSVCIF